MNSSKPTPVSPFLILIFGIAAVSTASVFIRFAQEGAPSLVVAAYRLGLATLILLPFSLRSAITSVQQLSRGQRVRVVLSGLFLALHFAAWITSLEYTSIASSVVLVTTTPLWVAIFSPLFLKEKMGKSIWIGLSIAIVGGVIVGLQEACTFRGGGFSCPDLGGFFRGKSILGNFLALFGAWMAAGYIMVGRNIRPVLSLKAYVFLVYGVAAIFLLGFTGLAGLPLVGYAPKTYLWLALLAVIPQILGHGAFNMALGYLPAAFVSLALLGEPVGTMILAMIILKEVPLPAELFGAALILAGIYIGTRVRPKP